MYCTDPGEVEHSTRLISDPVLLVGTTIQYTCNPGFVLEGSSLLTCYSRETGTPIWTSRLPHCVCKLGQLLLPCRSSAPLLGVGGAREALSCGQDLSQPRRVVQSHLKAGWGEISGASPLPPRLLLSLGSPSPGAHPGMCSLSAEESLACDNPGLPENGYQILYKRLYLPGESLTFMCYEGFELMGEVTIKCILGQPSHWSGPLPICKGNSVGWLGWGERGQPQPRSPTRDSPGTFVWLQTPDGSLAGG